MTVGGWLAELRRRDPVLFAVGAFHLGLLALMLSLAPFDARTVTGLNPWIKPIKFAVSITVYLWTLAWLLEPVGGPRWARLAVRWGASIAMVAEVLGITLQAARGVPSHYNVATSFDAAVFGTMGAMITINTLVAALFAGVTLRPGLTLPRAYLWGIRLGALLFVLGSLEATVMLSRNAHAVGVPDGGPGLPFLGWSTRAGDLRIAHLLGLHSLQALPLAGFLLSRWRGARESVRVAGLFAFASLYAIAVALLFGQALAGRPLLAL
jgi:hypothetical protein